jgi:hypothetical protein
MVVGLAVAVLVFSIDWFLPLLALRAIRHLRAEEFALAQQGAKSIAVVCGKGGVKRTVLDSGFEERRANGIRGRMAQRRIAACARKEFYDFPHLPHPFWARGITQAPAALFPSRSLASGS